MVREQHFQLLVSTRGGGNLCVPEMLQSLLQEVKVKYVKNLVQREQICQL